MTLGTRGDVQPFVALALGLAAEGHDAVLAAPHRYDEFVRDNEVSFAGIDDGPMRLMDRDSGSVVDDVASGGLSGKLAIARQLPGLFTRTLEDCWSVARDSDADVVVHNGRAVAGQHVAERLGIPAVLALPIPMYVPTREFPWPGQSMPRIVPNRLTFLGMKGPATMFARTVDRWRASMNLPRPR